VVREPVALTIFNKVGEAYRFSFESCRGLKLGGPSQFKVKVHVRRYFA